jgi:hypothetical protein
VAAATVRTGTHTRTYPRQAMTLVAPSGAPRGIRTPNRQIRSLVLYVHQVRLSAICAAQVRCQIQPDRLSAVW